MQPERRMCADSSPAWWPCSCALGRGRVLVPRAAVWSSDAEKAQELSVWEDGERLEHLGMLLFCKFPWKDKAANPTGEGLAQLPCRGHSSPPATRCGSAALSSEASVGQGNPQSWRITVPQQCQYSRHTFSKPVVVF